MPDAPRCPASTTYEGAVVYCELDLGHPMAINPDRQWMHGHLGHDGAGREVYFIDSANGHFTSTIEIDKAERREAALQAAATVYSGAYGWCNAKDVTHLAEDFEEWLGRA